MLTEPLFERWPPRDELEPEAFVDHREPAGGEGDALPVDASDAFTLRGGLMRKLRFRRQLCDHAVELTLTQRVQEIACECVFAPANVVGGAEVVLRAIVEVALKPSVELRQLAKQALSQSPVPDPFLAFSEICVQPGQMGDNVYLRHG